MTALPDASFQSFRRDQFYPFVIFLVSFQVVQFRGGRMALALGMAVATATLEVALDVGDRLAREFRSLGANLLVTSASDTLPLEIGGVDYRPVDAGAYLPAR